VGCGINRVECMVSGNGNLVNFDEERAVNPTSWYFKFIS
jgi:hypothetical protein